ncbi:hypothetical protein IWQ56_007127 [Coemansia nantahalensis]|nr:hypothetical protein IWQ56_007127 [Coemansia nantahalensis]
MTQDGSDDAQQHSDRPAILLRDVERPRWSSPPRVGIVYSAENWSHAEPLVNDLRYELAEHYGFSPVSFKVTQAESVHEIPLYIGHLHQRSDFVFAVGVVFRSAPDFEQRLVDQTTRRIGDIAVPGRLPVFDCLLVRDSAKHLDLHLAAGPRFAATWARRAIDAYNMMSRPGGV